MTGIRSRLFIFTCFMMLLATIPVSVLASPAKKPILEMIPKEVSGFLVLSDLARADQAAATLSTKTQLPIPGPVMILKMATGLGDAIDSKGSLAALYFIEKPKKEDAPKAKPGTMKEFMDRERPIDEDASTPVVFLFPINDFEKLVATFEKSEKVKDGLYKVEVASSPMFLTSKDGYALLAPEESRKSLDLVLKTKNNIVEELKPHKEWIDQQIFYGFLTQSGLNTYSTGLFKFELGNEGVFVEVEEDEDTEVVEEKEEEEKKSPQPNKPQKTEQKAEPEAVSYKDDISYLAMGVRVDDAGMIYVTARLGAKPDTQLSKDLSATKPLSDDLFAMLPQGTFLFAGGGTLPRKLKEFLNETEAVREVEIEEEGTNTKTTNTSRTALPTYKSFRESLLGQSYFVAPPQGEQAMVENICVVSWMKDSQKSLDAIQKDIDNIQEWFNETMEESLTSLNLDEEDEKESDEKEKKEEKKKPNIKITVKETTIEGCKAVAVTYDLSNFVKRLEEQMAQAGAIMVPMMGSIFEKIYGKDNKITEYNVQLDKHRILSTYCNDPELRTKLVKIAKTKTGGMADDKDAQKVLALLPAGAQWKGLWSPQGTSKYLDWYFKMITSMVPVGGLLPFDKLPELKAAPPVGVAGVASKELFEMTIVIPPDTLRNSIQYGMQLQAIFQSLQESNF